MGRTHQRKDSPRAQRVGSGPTPDPCTAQKSRRGGGSFLVVSDPRHHLFGMPILAQLASDHVLDTAYEWLCRRRRDYSPNADVWAFRRDWLREKEQIKADLLSGNYRFSLLSRITLTDDEDTDLWSARDALVLKALAIVLGEHLPVSRSCTHIKGHGGAKYAVRAVRDHLAANRFVLRTDVTSSHTSLDRLLLRAHVAVHV